jgi:hypothetical protein
MVSTTLDNDQFLPNPFQSFINLQNLRCILVSSTMNASLLTNYNNNNIFIIIITIIVIGARSSVHDSDAILQAGW